MEQVLLLLLLLLHTGGVVDGTGAIAAAVVT